MRVYRHTDQLPAFKNAVVTIGTFDGVHRGHCKIIAQLTAHAAQINGESVIITFDPHPRQIINGTGTVALINTLEEKIQLLEAAGVDHLIIVPFTEEFAAMSASEYIEAFLIQRCKPHTLIIGYDHQFGKNRSGNFELLEAYAAKGLFQLQEIAPELLSEAAISSTRIRKAVQEGAIQLANNLLGYPFRFEGVVVEGNKLGRTIGYPTANLAIRDKDKLVPGNAVYAVRVYIPVTALPGEEAATFQSEQPASGTICKNGMMNIGFRPTVNGTKRSIEVNIFDFDAAIYGAAIQVEVIDFIRKEVKFNGLDALKLQLAQDAISAETTLNTTPSS